MSKIQVSTGPGTHGHETRQRTPRRVTSIYMLIPVEWARAINLQHNDLAYLKPIEGRLDKFEVTLVKAPVPQELAE